jgi:glycosyltransferase involved in cell wall biosynthesis
VKERSVRLAFLSSTPPSAVEGSGTFVALDVLARGLRRRGHDVTFRALGCRTGFHTLDRWLYNAGVALAPPDADVIVGVDLDGFLWARRRAQGAFVVALKGIIADELRNERGMTRALLGVQARWERANVHRADRVMVPSRYSAAVAAEAYAVAPSKIDVVPEPIDLADWRRRFAAAPARHPTPTVLSVARMYPRKRLLDLLEAARLLRSRIPEARVRIVGDGPESGPLRARAATLGLEGMVTFLGDVPRGTLAVEYARAHCFCLPTVQEGFGIVFLEAMAAGLPVVGCRAAAVPEVVVEGRTGLLVSPRQPAELAAALATLLENDGLRKDLGAEAARHVEAFDVDRVAERFLGALPA